MNCKVISLYITNRCNLSCYNCFALKHLHLSIVDMDIDFIRQNLSEIENFETIFLSGGEAGLHPDFYSICKLFKRNIVVCTNGVKRFDAPSNVSFSNSNKKYDYDLHQPLHLEGREGNHRCFRMDQCGVALGLNRKWYACAVAPFIDEYKNLGLGASVLQTLDEESQFGICNYCL